MLKNVLAPSRLMLIVWITCLLAYVSCFGEMPTLRVLAWVAVMASVFSFGAGIDSGQIRFEAWRNGRVGLVRNLCLLLLPFQLLYVYKCVSLVSSEGGLANYLVAVRLAALSGEPLVENYAFYLQINMTLVLLSLFGLACILLKNEGLKYKKQLYIIYALTLVASVIDGSRSFFMVGLLSLVALNLAVGRLGPKRLLLFAVVALAVFTATFSPFRAEARDTDALSLIRYTFVYLCGSLGTMDPVLTDSIPIFWQDLEAISNKLSALGLPFPTYNLEVLRSDYVDLPLGFSTNVFSAFGLYYHYMGILGAIFFVAMIGWVSGVIYRSKLNSPFALTVYALAWPAVVLVPFHDYFVQQGYAVVKLAAYLLFMRLIYTVARVGKASNVARRSYA